MNIEFEQFHENIRSFLLTTDREYAITRYS